MVQTDWVIVSPPIKSIHVVMVLAAFCDSKELLDVWMNGLICAKHLFTDAIILILASHSCQSTVK